MNKHKPWIETSYHGVIAENTDVVLLDPPLVALDKDAPVPYAGTAHFKGWRGDYSNRGAGYLEGGQWGCKAAGCKAGFKAEVSNTRPTTWRLTA